MEPITKIGIDAGGTLVKIAYVHEEKLIFRKFSSHQLDQVVEWMTHSFDKKELCLTGGKANLLEKKLGHSVQHIVEFIATCEGATYLLQQRELPFPPNWILTNVGTGTSIHHLTKQSYERIGGTGIGGGTLIGLSYLLTGKREYQPIIALASQGDRSLIDLKVRDIYTESEPPIAGDLTASNFGKIFTTLGGEVEPLQRLAPADLIASIIGMIGETIATVSCQAANRFEASSIVYIGSTFQENTILKEVIHEYTLLREETPYFLEDGEFSGAVGALLALHPFKQSRN